MLLTMFGFISQLLTNAVESFDETFQNTPAHQIVLGTTALFLIYSQYQNQWISRAYRARHNNTPKQRVLDSAYELTHNLSPVKKYLNQELDKNLHSVKEKLTRERSNMFLQEEIPETGKPAQAILREFDIRIEECTYDFLSVKEGDKDKEFTVSEGDGQDSGALYAVHPKELTELLKMVYGKTALSNPMHDKWPRINAMQAEIIRWCQGLFNGSNQGYGLLTHGGTTSIIEAIAAYVINARARGVKYPEIVVPETAHAAFKKAADLTGAILITVPVNKKTGAVTAKAMSSYISGNTAVIVGSAPSFMNGICDPISNLGRLARKKNIPFHVDSCLGGFLTAFLNTSENPMDFRVPGVTSISADLHKYGCCPKGTSVCIFSRDSQALSVYAALNWSGGLYATPGILDGSTSGARVAEIYVTLSYYGRRKYQEIAENIINLRQHMQRQIADLTNRVDAITSKDIYVYADPQCSVLGFRSDSLNPHLIADELAKRGWKLNLLQNPNGFHLCLTHVHTLIKGFNIQFTHDLINAIAAVKAYPPGQKPGGNVKVYGAVGMMPSAVQKEVCVQYQKARLAYDATPVRLGMFAVTDKRSSDHKVQHISTLKTQ